MWDSSTWVESRIKSLMSLRSWRNIHHIQQCGVCKFPSAWSALLRKNVTCSLSNQHNSLLFPKKVAIWILHFVKYMNKHQLESFLFQCFFFFWPNRTINWSMFYTHVHWFEFKTFLYIDYTMHPPQTVNIFARCSEPHIRSVQLSFRKKSKQNLKHHVIKKQVRASSPDLLYYISYNLL